MSEIMNFIKPELLILLPVIYFIGMAMKKSQNIADKHIPLALGCIGVLLAVIYVVATSDITSMKDAFMACFVSITQGILGAGASVYVNQIVKQSKKNDFIPIETKTTYYERPEIELESADVNRTIRRNYQREDSAQAPEDDENNDNLDEESEMK